MTVFSILSTRAFREDCRPLALPMLMRCPSSSTWSTGLIWSMEPTTAVVAEMRPPRLRKCRSSTVNWWQRESLLASAQSRTSSMVRALLPLLGGVATPAAPGPGRRTGCPQCTASAPGTSHVSSSTAMPGGLEGGRQTGGEGQYQHVLASLEQGLDGLHVLGHVDCGGGGHLAGTEALVEDDGGPSPGCRGSCGRSAPPMVKAEGKYLHVQLPGPSRPLRSAEESVRMTKSDISIAPP